MTDTNRSCATCVFGKLYEKRNLREYLDTVHPLPDTPERTAWLRRSFWSKVTFGLISAPAGECPPQRLRSTEDYTYIACSRFPVEAYGIEPTYLCGEYQPEGALPVLKAFASDHPSAPQHP